MTGENRAEFIDTLQTIADVFSTTLTPKALEGYWTALEDLSIERFRDAAQRVLRSSRFMPRPADFRESNAGPRLDPL